MNKVSRIVFIIGMFLCIGGISYLVLRPQAGITPSPALNDLEILAVVSYQCADGKTMNATFYEGSSTPPTAEGMPPTPGGRVLLMLSDTRVFNLKETISADGVRYSNGDPFTEGSETFVFWSRGDGALVLENDSQQTYLDCLESVPKNN